ncbi:hypothetical protein BS50DRAFT_571558 [Corynespora cassiicola Philippines]|uniref:Aromatic prenyltransferase n=1 Tax=Corynespora cassiicola Philippines TaxID=1448308 RepID=A0A2T2NXY4_CORCC|nr:hypothetical protein BS50DRAFT_571558 [Corynespora cassiicola Philippines]
MTSDEAEARASWAALLEPHLHHALTASGSYTDTDTAAHLAFFRDHVCSWLGRAPVAVPPDLRPASQPAYQPAFPSALTCDATPLEISYSWKRGGNGPKKARVRYVVDVMPADGTPGRPASLAAAQRALDGLAAHQTGYRIDMLPDLWAAVTTRLAAWEQTAHLPGCGLCSPSSTFVGFDLASAEARGKLYWLLPACLPSQELLELLDDVLGVLPGFGAHWTEIRRYLGSHLGSSAGGTLRPRMLSIDATRYPSPRLKLYSRCHFSADAPFAAVGDALSLGGAIPQPPYSRSHYARLWAGVRDWYRQLPQLDLPQQRYCMVVHDMHDIHNIHCIRHIDQVKPIAGMLTSKLYWFCHQLPGRDARVIDHLLADFSEPAAFFQRQIQDGHFSSASSFIREIGLAQREDQVEVAAYVSPALFSPPPTIAS